jgi:hypothetical protein
MTPVSANSVRDAHRHEMQVLLRRIAGDARTKAALAKISDKLKLGERRVRDLWYGDPRVAVRPQELEAARRLAEEQKAVADAYTTLLARIERLERALLLADPEFGGAQVAALRCARGARNGMADLAHSTVESG